MNMSPLYAEIVKIRQEKAGAFAAILEKAKPLYHTLVQVMESALVSPKPEKSCIAALDLRNKPWINEKLSANLASPLPPIGKPSAGGLPVN